MSARSIDGQPARHRHALLGLTSSLLLGLLLFGAPSVEAREGHVHSEAEESGQAQEAVGATGAPNIVLILLDDLGFSDLGAYGSEVSTPNIDALADRGVLFSNYHSSPMCAPSRAMLMTGVSSHRAGVGNLPEFIPHSWHDKPGYLGHLAPGVTTIAQRLKPLGYDTFMTGKWHLGHAPGTLPSERGFDRTFILDATGADNWEDRSYLPYTDALWYEDGERTHLPDDWYSSRNLVDKMIGYIGDRAGTDSPFFAYLALQAVHIPVQAPREFTDKYLETYASGWSELRDRRRAAAVELGVIPADVSMRPIPQELRRWDALNDEERDLLATSMSVYAGMIEAMDFHVGRLIDHLKQIGEYENTVFIVTSDNGPEGTDPFALAPMRWWLPTSGYTRDVATLGERGSYNYIGPEFANAAAAPGAWFKFTSAEGGPSRAAHHQRAGHDEPAHRGRAGLRDRRARDHLRLRPLGPARARHDVGAQLATDPRRPGRRRLRQEGRGRAGGGRPLGALPGRLQDHPHPAAARRPQVAALRPLERPRRDARPVVGRARTLPGHARRLSGLGRRQSRDPGAR